jgi:hypothetical protein
MEEEDGELLVPRADTPRFMDSGSLFVNYLMRCGILSRDICRPVDPFLAGGAGSLVGHWDEGGR